MVHSSLITQAEFSFFFFPYPTNDQQKGENTVLLVSSASLKSSSEQTDANRGSGLPWSSQTSSCLVKCLLGSQLERGPTSPLATATEWRPHTHCAQRTTPKRRAVDRGGGGERGRRNTSFPNFSIKPPNSKFPSSTKPAGLLH
jgi:hypothetical protein